MHYESYILNLGYYFVFYLLMYDFKYIENANGNFVLATFNLRSVEWILIRLALLVRYFLKGFNI